MKRFILLLFALLVLHTVVFANPISESEARAKALQFISSKQDGVSSARSAQRSGSSVGTRATLTMAEAQEAFYVFNINSNGGYVIVSGDDRMPDVLGYSYSGTYDTSNMPDNMRAWLAGYAEQYEYLQTHSETRGASLTTVAGSKVYPLLSCQYDQNAPFNGMCPIIDGKRTATGCVAVTMSQIMHYYQWPNQTSKNIPAYVTSHNISISEIGITQIDWNNIAPEYSDYSSDAEKNAISTLMFLCGNSVKTDYGNSRSTSNEEWAMKAFVEYFGYDNSISKIEHTNYSDDAWNQMIYDEIRNGRPVFYSGQGNAGGHAFVIDGYDSNDYFHVNCGWGGRYNGYFLLTALKISNGTFNERQKALIGIQRQGSVEHKYAYAELNDNTLTFYYDNNRESRSGKIFTDLTKHEWTDDNYNSSIEHVKFDSSFSGYKYIMNMNRMFENMTNLVTVESMETVNAIYNPDISYMFFNCGSLTSVSLPNGITSVGHASFYNCSGLSSVSIPNSVTLIDEGAFFQCSSLKTIRIPGKVTDIKRYAFYGCTFDDVYCYAESAPSTGSNTFYDFYLSSAKLHVPGNAIDSYNATSPWNKFYDIIPLTASYYDYSRDMTNLDDRTKWIDAQVNVPNAVAIVENEQEPWAESQKNVVVENSNGRFCPNFVLTDLTQATGINYEQTGFYTPYSFTVKNGSYIRQAYAGFNTICVPFSFKASELSGNAKLYAFDSCNEGEGKVIFKRVKREVAAGTPCIVKETDNKTWNVSLAGKVIISGDPSAFGHMRGTYVTTDTYQGIGYSPNSNNEFAPLSQYLHPFRACFVISDESSARNIRIVLEDDITDISEISIKEDAVRNGKYLEQGKIVIFKNGRKYNANGLIMK